MMTMKGYKKIEKLSFYKITNVSKPFQLTKFENVDVIFRI